MIYQFANPDHTIIRAIDGDHVTVYDLGRAGWDEALSHDPAPYVAPAEPDPLDAERAAMQCTMLQARLALGADLCAALDAMAASAETPWALREVMQRATVIPRMSQDTDAIAWALGLSDAEVDDLFRKAMAI